MISNKMAGALILICCGFLVWYFYGRDKEPDNQKAALHQETNLSPIDQPEAEKSPGVEKTEPGKSTDPDAGHRPGESDDVTVAESELPPEIAPPPEIVPPSEKIDRAKVPETKQRSEKETASVSSVEVAVEKDDGDTWGEFRDSRLPGYRRQLEELFGHEVTIDIDWNSLGNVEQTPRLEESLIWDLNIIAKAFRGPLGSKTDHLSGELRQRVRQNIDEIRIRRVKGVANRSLEVTGRVVAIDVCWERYGSFSSRDIEILLLDRDREQFAIHVNAPETQLSPLMKETYRNRLPVLFSQLNTAVGRPVPVHLDWASLDTAADASFRLVYILGQLNKSIKELVKPVPGFGSSTERKRMLDRQRAEQRSSTVKNNLNALRIRGGSYRRDAVIRFDNGALELVVFQDDAYIKNPDADKDKQRAVTDFKVFPGCRRRAVKDRIVAELDLEAGPALQQAKAVHFPIAQAYMPEFFDQQIVKMQFSVPEKVALRAFLEANPITLEVDWDSLAAPVELADRMTSIRMLETGKYNYNDKYGELFRNFFHAVAEAARRDKDFLKSFISTVRNVRYEQISDPETRVLFSRGSTIVLRQCLYKQGGIFNYETLSNKLAVEVPAMQHAPSRQEMSSYSDLDDCLDGLMTTFDVAGVQGSIKTDGRLSSTPEAVGETCRRMLVPLNGALRYLMKQPGYLRVFKDRLRVLEILMATSVEAKGCRFQDGILACSGLPDRGVRGWLQGDELAAAVDDAMALKIRADIIKLESESARGRANILKDRFGWDVTVVVDWESFLAHPEEGGNRLYPIYVEQYGVERIVYALSGWMEDDAFKKKIMQRVDTIAVAGAVDMVSIGIRVENRVLVYRCFADISADGYLSRDTLQQHLYRLIIKEEQ